MRKIFFTALIAVFTMSLNAQTFGAKAGLNFANLTGDVENNKSITTFHVGAVAEFEISDVFSFQPELVFSNQGTRIKYSDVDVDYKMETSYLNIPLMAKYTVAEGISIQAGPQIGFLMVMKVDGETEYDNGTGKTKFKDDSNKIDFGLNFGAAYKMDSGMFFDLRYNLGLSDLADERDSDDNDRIKNGVFSLSVGYFFN